MSSERVLFPARHLLSAVHRFAMPDFNDDHDNFFVVNLVEDPIDAHARPVPICSGQLFKIAAARLASDVVEAGKYSFYVAGGNPA